MKPPETTRSSAPSAKISVLVAVLNQRPDVLARVLGGCALGCALAAAVIWLALLGWPGWAAWALL